MRRILHASDFSPASAPAFAKAVALAKEERAELSLLHVLDPILPVVGESSGRKRGPDERRKR